MKMKELRRIRHEAAAAANAKESPSGSPSKDKARRWNAGSTSVPRTGKGRRKETPYS